MTLPDAARRVGMTVSAFEDESGLSAAGKPFRYVICEYDEEKHLALIREEAKEQGRALAYVRIKLSFSFKNKLQILDELISGQRLTLREVADSVMMTIPEFESAPRFASGEQYVMDDDFLIWIYKNTIDEEKQIVERIDDEATERYFFDRHEGVEAGRIKGRRQMLAELVKDNVLPIAEAAKKMNLSVDEFAMLVRDEPKN